MTYIDKYNEWLNYKELDPELRSELEAIKGDDTEIKERFGAELAFGTAVFAESLPRVQTE